MAHRSGAISLLVVVVLPVTVAAALAQEPAAPAISQEQPPPFEHWMSSPASYLVTEKEKRIGESIAGSAEFAAYRQWFWHRRDPFPETAVNEFRTAFEERVDFANKEFGNALTGTPGWRTPRGVVYIMLGQPTRITRSVSQLYRSAGASAVYTWVYEFPDAPLLEVPFVEVDGAFTILSTPVNRPMQTRLEQALRRVAERSVRDRDTPFSFVASPVGRPGATAWPAHAALHRTESGIDAELTIPLSGLYGHADGEDLRVELRFTATAAAGGQTIDLGTLNIFLPRGIFERAADHDLTLALWLPPMEQLGDAAWIDVTEVASNRGLRLAMHTESEQIAATYDVQELISYARLLDGGGAVFAFVCDHPDGHDHTIHLLRSSPGVGGVAVDDSIPGFRLIQDQTR